MNRKQFLCAVMISATVAAIAMALIFIASVKADPITLTNCKLYFPVDRITRLEQQVHELESRVIGLEMVSLAEFQEIEQLKSTQIKPGPPSSTSLLNTPLPIAQ